MNVIIIPARGGSKRVPGKNIKNFYGKPIIAWPIAIAQASGLFDRIIVSTDSEEIAAVAREWGAETPFLRPANLADDYTPTAPVLAHALDVLSENGCDPEYTCCMYPATPFVLPEYLRQGLEKLRTSNAPGVVSVTTFSYPILRTLHGLDDGSVAFYWPEYELTRSQDLKEFFHDAGQFYWFNTKRFRVEKRLVMPGALPFMLPRERTLDIDTPEDWRMAELMGAVLLSGEQQS